MLLMNLEDILLSHKSQTQKDKYCMIPLIQGPQAVKLTEQEGRMGGCQGLRAGEMKH